MPRKIFFKLLLVLIIPLFLSLAIYAISESGNLWVARVIGFLILIIFGIYASLFLFFRFGRSMNVAYRGRGIFRKAFIFGVLFLLLIAVMIGLNAFFEVAFKFIGL